MLATKTMDVVSRYASAIRARDLDGMLLLHSPKYLLDYAALASAQVKPVAGNAIKALFRSIFKAFPDGIFTVTHLIATENVAVQEWVFTGTSARSFKEPVFDFWLPGLTGRQLELRGVSVYEFDRGLIQHETIYLDDPVVHIL